MKYILVTGGVISGVGKGVIASSFGTILKHCNIRVTSIKIDPYINIDAGTFSPYEHGKRQSWTERGLDVTASSRKARRGSVDSPDFSEREIDLAQPESRNVFSTAAEII